MKSNRWACVARLGGLGDNLIAASVLAPLKRMGYMVEVMCSAPNHVVFHRNPHIDKLSVKDGTLDLPQNDQQAWQNWFAARSREYDLFAHLSHSCEARHALFPHMTPFWWHQDYRRKICGGSYLETAHDIAGVPYEFGPLYYASEEEKTRALETRSKMGKRVVAWVLAGSRLDKIHPYSPSIVSRLIKDLDVDVMLIGAPNPKQFSSAKTIMQDHEITNSTSKRLHLAMTVDGSDPGGSHSWPIRRSLAQIQASDLVITPDTGSAWAVAMEPTPKIVMVSHASAENITKHWVNTTTLHADPERVPCWPCHRLHNDPATCVANKENNGAACISDISVETVMVAARAALG